jgi:hypothetical protein
MIVLKMMFINSKKMICVLKFYIKMEKYYYAQLIYHAKKIVNVLKLVLPRNFYKKNVL